MQIYMVSFSIKAPNMGCTDRWPKRPLRNHSLKLKFNNLAQKLTRTALISAIRRSPKLTLFYVTQIEVKTREDEKSIYYTFPRDVRSHNVYTKNSLFQALVLWGRSKKRVRDARPLFRSSVLTESLEQATRRVVSRKRKPLRGRYANTSNDTAVILNAYFIYHLQIWMVKENAIFKWQLTKLRMFPYVRVFARQKWRPLHDKKKN